MAQKLTDKIVKGLKPPEKGQAITFDSEIRGFGVRCTPPSKREPSGGRAFVVDYWVAGRQRRITIGKYPGWSVAAARVRARELRQQIDQGLDPMAERHAEREAPTVADLCDRYIEEHLPRKRPKSRIEDQRMIRKIVKPGLGKKKVVHVEFSDIDRLHRSKKSTPYAANRLLALLSKIFALAETWKIRPQNSNPCRGVERFHEETRQVYLNHEETARLMVALDDHPNQEAANAIRFLYLTGARRGEVLGATWGQFADGLWSKPSSHTKQRRAHQVPLPTPALELLNAIRPENVGADTPVFVNPDTGQPFHNLYSSWRTIRKSADLEHVRLHDLRHSYAAVLVSGGASLPLVGALLGHSQPQTTARYSHLHRDSLKEAAEKVGAFIESAGKSSAPVIPLRRGKS